jgi:uncharacterized protein (TIGR00288 family)
MSSPYSRAPHTQGAFGTQPEALNAALLIDFDNVTMGMRSDLSKELNNLLNSDIIKGKVTVQRAYADWRRYPQYIVPLSENSVDLIFAPAYGSSKKNATDIRMAIDAIELVFIRPEIGTYILLTGDSDFSAVVLKLKEYGKYVIGVGIQESSSDILVQNCDEYYSYTSLTGLRKTTDSDNKPVDPWVLVEQAAARMASRDDVMRSDRLKQVMIEIDATFDEGNFGFSKFSRFLSEAGSRGLVVLRKLENGQYEVLPSKGGGKASSAPSKPATRKPQPRGRAPAKGQDEKASSSRGRGRSKAEARPDDSQSEARGGDRQKAGSGPEKESRGSEQGSAGGGEDPLRAAYGILRQALESLSAGGTKEGGVRDSDLKRKMLRLESSFDEGKLGFGKFSRFLRQAHDHEIIDLQKRDDGTYQVSARVAAPSEEGKSVEKPAEEPEKDAKGVDKGVDKGDGKQGRGRSGKTEKDQKQAQMEIGGEVSEAIRGVGLRRGTGRSRKGKDGPPPFLEGQVVAGPGATVSSTADPAPEKPVAEPAETEKTTSGRTPRTRRGKSAPKKEAATSTGPVGGDPSLDLATLGLPTGGTTLIRYLTNSYKGVGRKTAETVVNEFGAELFQVLHREPGRLSSVLPAARVEQLLQGWSADLARRTSPAAAGEAPKEEAETKPGTDQAAEAKDAQADSETENKAPSRRRTRGSGSGRGRARKKEPEGDSD